MRKSRKELPSKHPLASIRHGTVWSRERMARQNGGLRDHAHSLALTSCLVSRGVAWTL